jgi:cell wall-associated NlpC family hydrolase
MSRNGTDCSGFIVAMYRSVAGVQLPRTTREQFRLGKAVSLGSLQPGDLLFFNTTGLGVSHVGICLGGDQFVHASTSRGVILSSLKERYYASRFLGAHRIITGKP